MKVLMIPMLEQAKGGSNGISRVVEAYHKYLAPYGVEFAKSTDESADIIAAHAGVTGKTCDVAHLHGMYFTADYEAPRYEYKANKNIVESVRSAKEITVPSNWVAEIFRRDMHINPTVVPHGIDTKLWENNYEKEHYVLWNKNRGGLDACTTDHLANLALRFPTVDFVSTFSPENYTGNNIHVTGVVSPDQMKTMVQKCGVYLSTTKETFGIGILEAMASGVPVLGFDYGGNSILVQHKVNGYLAEPGNYEDLYRGLEYCMKHSKELGKAGVELAKMWTWEQAAGILYEVYKRAANPVPDTVSIVIPCYNYSGTLERAVRSAVSQSYPIEKIVIVNDGSTDNTEEVANRLVREYNNVYYIKQKNSGVANARNFGVLETHSKYVACLDADDELDKDFVRACLHAFKEDQSIGIAYTKMKFVGSNGNEIHTDWPDEYIFDLQLERKNQVPTACLFTRNMFDRTGGYRQRFAPTGAGAEDAELWLRAGSLGIGGKLASRSQQFIYHAGGNTQRNNYKEVDWLNSWHPWAVDGVHPFASLATPKFMAHDVHQYDQPMVSVIIPVGPGHEKTVIDSLDSLEAQTFRDWEAIVVWDSEVNPIPDYIMKAFPFAKFLHTPDPKSGAGVARNIGARAARAKLIMFLDADDYLAGTAIESMIRSWNQTSDSIVYSDYYGISMITDEYKLKLGDRLIDIHPKTGESLIRYYSQDYDCQRAQLAPDFTNKEIYHWCLVTCLIPKVWHESIGGFDETMKSWEDVDYHWRMSHAGFCYSRIHEPLVVYRFSTGYRRELAVADGNSEKLIQYISNKYRSVKMSPCSSCGKPYTDESAVRVPDSSTSPALASSLKSGDASFVLCEYIHPSRGEHQVVGYATQTKYGYRAYGDKFLVHVSDIAATPQYFRRVEGVVREVRDPRPIMPESVVTGEGDFINEEILTQMMPSMKISVAVEETKEQQEEKVVEVKLPTKTAQLSDIAPPTIVEVLTSSGITTVEKLAHSTVEELTAIKGIGEKRAQSYIAFAKTLNGE
jgi:glycosyltransferase involved in cell wall biosynthesis